MSQLKEGGRGWGRKEGNACSQGGGGGGGSGKNLGGGGGGGGRGWGGYAIYPWVGRCGPTPHTLTDPDPKLFLIKSIGNHKTI